LGTPQDTDILGTQWHKPFFWAADFDILRFFDELLTCADITIDKPSILFDFPLWLGIPEFVDGFVTDLKGQMPSTRMHPDSGCFKSQGLLVQSSF
jgi:hypothetical protein